MTLKDMVGKVSSFIGANPTPYSYAQKQPIVNNVSNYMVGAANQLKQRLTNPTIGRTISSAIPVTQLMGYYPSQPARQMVESAKGFGQLIGTGLQTATNKLIEPITKNPASIRIIPENTLSQYSHSGQLGRMQPLITGGMQTLGAEFAAMTPAMAATNPLGFAKMTVGYNAGLQGTGELFKGIREKQPIGKIALNVLNGVIGESNISGPVSGLLGETPTATAIDTAIGLGAPIIHGLLTYKQARDFYNIRNAKGQWSVAEIKKTLGDKIKSIKVNNVIDPETGQTTSMPIDEYMKKFGNKGFIDFSANVGGKAKKTQLPPQKEISQKQTTQTLPKSISQPLSQSTGAIPKELVSLAQDARKYNTVEDYVVDLMNNKVKSEELNRAYNNAKFSENQIGILEKKLNQSGFKGTIQDFYSQSTGGVGGVKTLKAEVQPKIKIQAQETLPTSKSIRIVSGEKNVIPSDTSIPQGMKERKFVTTVKESVNTPPQPKETLNAYYRPTSNPQEAANAQNALSTLGWDKAKEQIRKGAWSGDNAALSEIMAQKSYAEGKWNEGNEIIKMASTKATQAGQGNQALAMWSKYTPEGMVKYAQGEVEHANNTMPLLNKILGTKSEWSGKDSEVITGMMKKVNSLPEGQAKNDATKQVFEYISKKLPWGVSDVIDEFRYNNMLSNPLTHLRNAVNNLQQAFLVRPATLLASGKPMEAVKYEIGALKGLPDAISAFIGSFKGESRLGKMDIVDIGSQLRVPKKLGKFNLPSDAMEGMDRFFSTIIRSGETARGATSEQAAQMAEYSLFRGDLNPTSQGVILNSIDNATRAIYQLRKVGLGWFIPFLRTPMNVAKQWIEYSPVGVADIGLSKLTKVEGYSGREQMGKVLLGSIATLVGANLSLQGRTTWDVPTDPTLKKLFYDSGRKPFAFNPDGKMVNGEIVGGHWIPMQTTGVFALALALPAAVNYFNKESRTALTDDKITKITKMLLSPLGFWSQQTFVSGLGSFVNLAQGNTDFSMTRNLAQTVSQLNPWGGLQRYISTLIDPIFRKPDTNSFSQQLSTGVPFLTKNLPAYTDTFGNESKRNLSNYIAPYAIGQGNPQFENMYQQRTIKLQDNAVVNKAKNDIEQQQGEGKLVGNKYVYWDEDTASAKTIDMSKKGADIELTKVEVIKSGQPKQLTSDSWVYLDEDGKAKYLDLGKDVLQPNYTGNELIDKKLKSQYTSALTAKQDDAIEAFKQGLITQEEAANIIETTTKIQTSLKAAKKPKKVTLKLTKPKKIANIKIKLSKPKKVKLSKLKPIKLTKLKKIVNIT